LDGESRRDGAARERAVSTLFLPPGRLIPAKTRLFVDEITKFIKADWGVTAELRLRG
jgi:hypothetical protein